MLWCRNCICSCQCAPGQSEAKEEKLPQVMPRSLQAESFALALSEELSKKDKKRLKKDHRHPSRAVLWT